MNMTKTLQAFIEEHKITLEAVKVDANPYTNDHHLESDHWKITLTGMFHGGAKRILTTFFSKGPGETPTPTEVLSCLLSDAASVEDTSFEDWAEELGLSPDSRKAERLYNACRDSGKQLRAFLDETYREALDLDRD